MLLTCIICGLGASFIGGLVGTRFIVLKDTCVCPPNIMGAPNTMGTLKSTSVPKAIGISNTEVPEHRGYPENHKYPENHGSL